MRRPIRLILAAVILGAALWLNYSWLMEAYGSGPPYYGRTTNMDKWSSPLPLLAVADTLALALLALLLRRSTDPPSASS
ncbi:MAG: hypothetical protein JNK87_07045 [Bryobacterales bacterium]|nr:hypothetical protein [Bryobacterales bacterium]